MTTAGGIEEDFIKCLAPTYIGDFALKGATLREKGINRIGNMLVPNDNYCKFEDWIMPILDEMVKEQKATEVSAPNRRSRIQSSLVFPYFFAGLRVDSLQNHPPPRHGDQQ